MSHSKDGEATIREIAEQHARMVYLAILKLEPDRAYAAVDAGIEKLVERNRPVKLTDDISRVVQPRLIMLLRASGVRTVGDLCAHSRTELQEMHRVTFKSLDIIERQLDKHGLGLRR